MKSWSRITLVSLLVVAMPALAQQWQQVRRDAAVMLSVDLESIKTKNGETAVNYLVDFRQAQGMAYEKHYRSIVVRARLRCQDKQISLLHTDAFAQWRGEGIIVAKTQNSQEESAFHPLEKDSSDEDVWRFVCEVRKGQGAPHK